MPFYCNHGSKIIQFKLEMELNDLGDFHTWTSLRVAPELTKKNYEIPVLFIFFSYIKKNKQTSDGLT